jgi:hypothetical protein
LHSPCLITTLIASISAQARTPVVSSRNWQIPTRPPRVQATCTRAGTPLRAQRISSHDTQHPHAFLRRAHVHVGGLHVARRLRAARLAVHPGFVPPHPDASTGASNVSSLRAVPGQAHLPVNLDYSPILAHALSFCDFSPSPALRATASSTFLPWPRYGPAPGSGAEFVLSALAKPTGTLAYRPSMDRGSRNIIYSAGTSETGAGWVEPDSNPWAEGVRGASARSDLFLPGLQRVGPVAASRPRRSIPRILPAS